MKKYTYDNLVIPCHVPTLKEAMDRFRETGEFILSGRDDEAYDSPNRDVDIDGADLGVIDVVSAACRYKEQKSPVPNPDPAPSPVTEPVPSAPAAE